MPSFASIPVLKLFVARPAPAPRPRTRKRRPLRNDVLRVLCRRLDAAIERNAIELVELPEDVPLAAGPAVHTRALGELLAVLFREEYGESRNPIVPSDAAPHTEQQIRDYCERAMKRQRVKSPLDRLASRDPKLSYAGNHKSNGAGIEVRGWTDDEDEVSVTETFELSREDLAVLSRRRTRMMA